ncbi:MAG TPA: hypothetical protein VMC85_19610 [Desulfomonilaceae bacterium]|nr:hypothetical protein [Desulfomonilaceae bacterium]
MGLYFALLESLEGLNDIIQYCKVTGIRRAREKEAKATDNVDPTIP